MDNLLAKFREDFVFIYDILILTKGTKKEPLDKVQEILNSLDAAKLQLKTGKCIFAKKLNWVPGYKLTSQNISPKKIQKYKA